MVCEVAGTNRRIRGSVERGLQYLRLAAERGQFVGDDSRVMLMILEVRERKYGLALEAEEYLQKRYLRGYLLPITRAQILEKMGSREDAVRAYQNLIAWSDAGLRNYDKLKSGHARYSIGRKLMDLDRYDLALEQIRVSVRDAGTAQDLALGWLAAGECLDMLGYPGEAASDYRLVLSLEDFDGTHQEAKTYIARGYRPARR